MTMRDLIARIQQTTRPGADEKLAEFRDQCEKRDSKLAVETDYERSFREDQRDGSEFFGRVCQLIENSRGFCFAVDRADLKGVDLVRSWREDVYRTFKEATKVAAARGVRVERLFVIQEPLQYQVHEIREFLDDFIATGMTVGIIYASQLQFGPLKDRFDTDFIVTNVTDASLRNFEGAVGFELQDKEFRVALLSWEVNLIAKSRMPVHHEIFGRLWATAQKCHKGDPASVTACVDKLLKG